MKKLKLTELQSHQLCLAQDEARSVLREIKKKTLPAGSQPLRAMQALESAVAHLETFDMLTRRH